MDNTYSEKLSLLSESLESIKEQIIKLQDQCNEIEEQIRELQPVFEESDSMEAISIDIEDFDMDVAVTTYETSPQPEAEPEQKVSSYVQATDQIEESSSIFNDMEDASEQKTAIKGKNINDVAEAKPKKAIIDIANSEYAWKKDMPGAPVKNILSAISLGDRAQMINSLFKGSPEDFSEAMNTFNTMTSFDEVISYIEENYPNWDLKSDLAYRFMMAVRRKLR